MTIIVTIVSTTRKREKLQLPKKLQKILELTEEATNKLIHFFKEADLKFLI